MTNRRLRLSDGTKMDWQEASDLNKEFAKRFEVEPFDLATHNRADGFPVEIIQIMKREIHPEVKEQVAPLDDNDDEIAEAFEELEEKVDHIKDLMNEGDTEEETKEETDQAREAF